MNPNRVDFVIDLTYGLLIFVAIALILLVETVVGIAFGLGVLASYVVHIGWKMARFNPEWMTKEVAEKVEETVTAEVGETISKEMDDVAEEVEKKVTEEVGETVEDTISKEMDDVAEEVEEKVEEDMAEGVESTVSEQVAETVSEQVEESVSATVEESVGEEVDHVAREVEETVSEQVEQTIGKEVEQVMDRISEVSKQAGVRALEDEGFGAEAEKVAEETDESKDSGGGSEKTDAEAKEDEEG
ncbi:MAG: hypothetical protein U5K70_03660 [Halodesulfurarchaeum sp.]|nr:hypothetical protein [Halodesulfurarchaeum sp.]